MHEGDEASFGLLDLIVVERLGYALFGQQRAVPLHRWKLEIGRDASVGDFPCLIQRAPLEPLGRHGARRNGRAAPKRLEPRIHNDAVDHAHLNLHYVTTRRRADKPCAHIGARLVELAHVARPLKVVHDLE